ncbi:MAG: hypothetical protein ACYC6Z_05170 [Thermoleophilia bacterium]
MKRIAIVLTLLLLAPFCLATGWNDYTLDIGDGYDVFRANSLDVCIGKSSGSLILCPSNYDNVGPIDQYITTPQHIFTKNLGRKPRNLFEGDTFQDIDSSKTFYFIISKANDEVIGPLTEDEFARRPEVTDLERLNWQTPHNPNFLLPILGSLMFLAISIPILAIKFFWITVPATIVSILLLEHGRKKRRKGRNKKNS